jgi:hypothetical protein
VPDNEDSIICVDPPEFRGRSYRELLDDMTKVTQRALVRVISQPSPSGALAKFAAYLKRRRAENDGDDNRHWIGEKHFGETYREIYTRDRGYVDWLHWVSAILRKSLSETRLSACWYDAHSDSACIGGAEGGGLERPMAICALHIP